mmetsp:Transcript_81441/g.141411  ORF Transcript_81441/g.141411 Transcript_81441/m.141411 type:complete len:222 (+) Transcript_81441:167-832(+)
MLCYQSCVNLDLWSLGILTDKLEVWLVCQAPGEPQEGLLKIVVATSTEIVILQVALPMELDVLGLDLAILDINFIAHEHNGNVLTDADNVSMPVRHVLVGDAGGDIEHDYRALALDVVAVAQATKLFLTGSVPNVEAQRTAIGGKIQRPDLDTQGRNVLLLKLTSQVALYQRGLTDTTISNQHQLEFGCSWCRHCLVLLKCLQEGQRKECLFARIRSSFKA